MGDIIKLNRQPYWKSFKLPDGKQRWFYTDDETKLEVDKKWFNKSTIAISIRKGYETEEYSTEPISNMIYHILIDYQILNYFGDKSGMHYRSKEYMLIGDKLYKQEKGEGIEMKRVTKELKGALEKIQQDIKNMKKSSKVSKTK